METVVEALERFRGEGGRGFTFLHQDGEKHHFSFEEIYGHARRRARGLQDNNVREGDRVALILPVREDFVFTFYGCLLASIIPVPMYPPIRKTGLQRYLDNARHIISSSGCRVLVTTSQLKALFGTLLTGTPLQMVLATEKLTRRDAEPRRVEVELDDIAFIQYTSGSTAYPKGVAVTHRNIAANVRCFMEEGIEVSSEDVGVTWLPLYHDMGLIGFVLGPTYYRIPIIFMPPLMFLRRPIEWLGLISQYEATVSFAPNFAYGLCAARVKDEQLEGIDLRSWRVAGCGAEPIRYETLTEFGKRFEKVGFRRESFLPAYGMAESTLAITFSGLGAGLTTDVVQRSSLCEEGKAVPCGLGSEDHVVLVSCGTPFSGHQLAVVDESDSPLPERRVGEIIVAGPSVTKGYYNNEEATKDTFRNRWLHTGDLGYVTDGNLYICGRKKDLIIVGGRNYYPQDIEWVVGEVNGIRKGSVIAFGRKETETLRETVVVAAESRMWKDHADELKGKIRKAVTDALNIRVGRTEILPPESLPKTSSGKVQRRKACQLFEAGELGRLAARPTSLRCLFASKWHYWKHSIKKAVRRRHP